jgi:hypothetical protein
LILLYHQLIWLARLKYLPAFKRAVQPANAFYFAKKKSSFQAKRMLSAFKQKQEFEL